MSSDMEYRHLPLGNGLVLEDLHVAHLRKWKSIRGKRNGITLFAALHDYCSSDPAGAISRVKRELLRGRLPWFAYDVSDEHTLMRPIWMSRSPRRALIYWIQDEWVVNPIGVLFVAATLCALGYLLMFVR